MVGGGILQFQNGNSRLHCSQQYSTENERNLHHRYCILLIYILFVYDRKKNSCVLTLQPDEDAGSAPSGSGKAQVAVAPAPSVGGGDMMSEMAKRLRDRKAKAEMNNQANVCTYSVRKTIYFR